MTNEPIRVFSSIVFTSGSLRSTKPLDTRIEVFVSGYRWAWGRPVAQCYTAGTKAELRREADRMMADVRAQIIDEIGG